MVTSEKKRELSQPTGRRRAYGRACAACRQRKIRCDSQFVGTPCSNCRSRSRPDCHAYNLKWVRSEHKPEPKPRQSLQSRRSINQAADAVSPRPDDDVQPTTTIRPEGRLEGRDHDDDTSNGNTNQPDHSAKSSSQLQAAEVGYGGGNNEEQASRSLGEFIHQENTEPLVIGYSTRLYFIGTASSNLNYLVRRRARKGSQDARMHFASRQLARKHTAHDHDRMPADAYTLPPQPLADELMETYFARVNRGWPIVDEEDFMARYTSRDTQDHPGLTLLNAIFLVGAHVLSGTRPELADLKPIFYRRAKVLFDNRFEQNRTMHVQVALLMTWYSDGIEDILANTWHWVGLAVRIAFGLGMHCDSSNSGLLPVYKRTWVRLWWVLVQFDVLTSVFYGRPRAINLADCNVPSLEAAHFQGIPNARQQFVMWHTELCKAISKLIDRGGLFRSSASPDLTQLKEADVVLAEFAQLAGDLRLNVSTGDIWQFTFHLIYNNFIILLHRHVPTEVVCSSEDLDICRGAVTAITTILDASRTRGMTPDLYVFGVNAAFTSIIQVSAELHANNPLVSARAQQNFDLLLLSLRELSQYWLYAQSVLGIFDGRDSRTAQERQRDIGHTAHNVKDHNVGGDGLSRGAMAHPSPSSGLRHVHGEELVGPLRNSGDILPSSLNQEPLCGRTAQTRGETSFSSEAFPIDMPLGAHLDLLTAGDTSALELFLAGLDDDLGLFNADK